MTHQLPLNLPVEARSGREDFFVSASNQLALAEMDRWRTWPQHKLVLIGPQASGKSHLARIWADQSSARILPASALVQAAAAAGPTPALHTKALVVEDVPELAGHAGAEQALLHLHNLILADGGHLLLTGQDDPARWPIVLPDLASRIRGTPTAQLHQPDDALMTALLVKLFEDRGIAAPPALIPWLIKRMERSCRVAQDLVARIDAAALASKRPVGRKLASEVLDGNHALPTDV